MLLETFHEVRTNTLRTGMHEGIPIHYGLWLEYLVTSLGAYLNCTNNDQNHVTKRI